MDTARSRRFLHDGWNLIGEFALNLSTSTLTTTRSFTWGLDIARTLSDAGGVGALLQIADPATSRAYFATYDGNGGVAALVDGAASMNGAVVAAYEYSPYGEFIRCEGTYAKENPFRFSTKFTDDETGLVYYGRRYYSPINGRFLGRDPIEEKGGLNLYGFCSNNAINLWDLLGMRTVAEVEEEIREIETQLEQYRDKSEDWLGRMGLDGVVEELHQRRDLLNTELEHLQLTELTSNTVGDFSRRMRLGLGRIPVVGDIIRSIESHINGDDGDALLHTVLAGLQAGGPSPAAAGRVLVAGVTVTLRTVAAAVARAAASPLLRRNMVRDGIQEIGDYVAHHIVPFGAEGTQAARDVLIKYGIDINNSANGVFISASVNAGLHNNPAYRKAVTDAITRASLSGKDAVLAALRGIRDDIAAGIFPGLPTP